MGLSVWCIAENCQQAAALHGGACDLTTEIKRAPEVFDLLVSLTYLGAKGAPPPGGGSMLNPFPKKISGASSLLRLTEQSTHVVGACSGKDQGKGQVYFGEACSLLGVGTNFRTSVSKGDFIYITEKLPNGNVEDSKQMKVLNVSLSQQSVQCSVGTAMSHRLGCLLLADNIRV